MADDLVDQMQIIWVNYHINGGSREGAIEAMLDTAPFTPEGAAGIVDSPEEPRTRYERLIDVDPLGKPELLQ